MHMWNACMLCHGLRGAQLAYGAVLLYAQEASKKSVYEILEIHYYNTLVQHKAMHTHMYYVCKYVD